MTLDEVLELLRKLIEDQIEKGTWTDADEEMVRNVLADLARKKAAASPAVPPNAGATRP